MIARCPFNDAETGTLRRTGDTFDCSEERARRLVALKLAAVAKDQEATEPEQAPVEPADEQGEAERALVKPADEQAPEDPVQEKKQAKKASAGKGKGKASPKKTK